MSVSKIVKSIFRFGLLLGSIVAIVLLSSYAVIQVVLRGGRVVEVPNVLGDSFYTASRTLEEVGLQMRAEREEYSSVVQEGNIIYQRPVGGSRIKSGRVVLVTVSKGSEMLAVPDVTGEELRQAEMRLTESRLAVGHVSQIHVATKKGIVLAQNPGPKTSIEIGANVDLLVSAGRRLTRYLLPNVVGMNLNEAVQLLSQLNLKVQTQPEVRPRAKPGTVLAQEPAPNVTVEEGDSTLLTVSTRSKTKRWENLRHLVLTFEVPFGFSRKLVRIEMADVLGTETVLRDLFAPGEIVTLPVSYSKRVTVSVFVDGTLRQQTYADAANERTLIFTQPWGDAYETKNSTIAPFR